MQFPVFKTKIKGVDKTFDLNDPKQKREYFELKAGKELKKLRDYFKRGNTFIAYLIGKKNSGKGTYAKMFAEIVGNQYVEHFSIGDMIRRVDGELKNKKKKKELIEFLENNYRGKFPVKELISLLGNRSTSAPLLPTELILALVEREISSKKKKTLFIDGFPRGLDQINFTLFFRNLVGYRQDDDVFILISVPEKVIEERIKFRRVCPKCQSPQNLKLHPTKNAEYDENKKEFYLICDNPKCKNIRMVSKEGDEKGLKPIRARLMKDEELLKQASALYGIPKIYLRNAVPKAVAKTMLDDYEITPEYYYERDGKNVQIKERSWVFADDEGKPSYSQLPPAVVLSLIKQLTKILNL